MIRPLPDFLFFLFPSFHPPKVLFLPLFLLLIISGFTVPAFLPPKVLFCPFFFVLWFFVFLLFCSSYFSHLTPKVLPLPLFFYPHMVLHLSPVLSCLYFIVFLLKLFFCLFLLFCSAYISLSSSLSSPIIQQLFLFFLFFLLSILLLLPLSSS